MKERKVCIFMRQTLTDFGFSLFFSFRIYTFKKKSVEDTRNELALLSDHTTNIKQEKKNKGKG
jgi:stalled ribosome alternative rescue factor ArfA